jgi:hypothetical protein
MSGLLIRYLGYFGPNRPPAEISFRPGLNVVCGASEPEGVEDDLRGTDLKERFYNYLLGLRADNQVIVIENEHPPEVVFENGNVVVFTKNPHQGRYGFFPHTG